ncbi:ABC transporter permease [Xanthomonas citri]|uniref:ABC transporter permease n=1 Tax=Xanthomonas citri TaxID=346 RepID=UPI000C08546C|nr:ABC transporter permease [Xanthomonas citri]
MSAAQLLQQARAELRAGLRSGIVGLVFVGLAGYLLMCLTNADYVQQMGGTDIPRNAPSLIYLMSTGCMFFLFFAWAWVFAQSLLRDRQANLHEVVLSLPICLPALLWGRFIGAALVGTLLASALIVGFIAAPVLGWLGLVPAGSIAAPPWRALLFAWGWLLLPAGTGIGALYYLITLRTRSVAAAFGLSALLMLLWMFAVVVLKGGDINPLLAAVLDPSLFTFAHTRIEAWTPLQKSTALLPMTPGFVLNRAVWGALPLALLAWALHGVRRESLVLEAAAPRAAVPAAAATQTPAVQRSLAPVAASHWGSALWLETYWQLRQLARSRGWWAGMTVLAAMCVLSAFVHGIWHADGPLLPRPDLLLPLLKDATYLVIAFLIAALTGWVWRRDQVDGFDSMFDALPAPVWLRPFARALAVIAMTVLLSLLPGAAAVLVTALALPAALDLSDALLYQLLVMAPPLLELGLLSFLVHALCRRAGAAYSLSMLLTFILVVNHELGMADYPLYQVGIPVHLQLSGLSGWAPWRAYLLALDGYKLALCVSLVAAAVLVLPRGVDSRLRQRARHIGNRLRGPVGVLASVALVGLLALGTLLNAQLIGHGGYRPLALIQREDAAWERRWLADAGAYTVVGGDLRLQLDPAAERLQGAWTLHGVRAATGSLHAELPNGFVLQAATVDGRRVSAEVAYAHLVVPLGACASRAPGCTLRLQWSLAPNGWSAEGQPAWLGHAGFWLRAQDAAPRLGLDPDRVLRSAGDRRRYGLGELAVLPPDAASVASDAIAPRGTWRWSLQRGGAVSTAVTHGRTQGPLTFAVAWAADPHQTLVGPLRIVHDRRRADSASGIGTDVQAMQACVQRRLGHVGVVQEIAQWPRGLGEPRLLGTTLVLPEAPSWDVADLGVGGSLRRARIASALARQALANAADLRQGRSAAWLGDGVAGALGLLCVGDVDGLAALQQALIRSSDTTARVLADSDVPVGALTLARSSGWAQHYAALAALDWTARQRPQDFDNVTRQLAARVPLADALAAHAGPQAAAEQLGAPLASQLSLQRDRAGTRIDASRWRWHGGGWKPATDSVPHYRLLTRRDGVVRLQAAPSSYPRYPPDSDGLLLDAWPSYQRNPQQLLLHPETGSAPPL